MASPEVDPSSTSSGLRGNVGWVGIVFFVVAAAAPLTVVFGSLPPALILQMLRVLRGDEVEYTREFKLLN